MRRRLTTAHSCLLVDWTEGGGREGGGGGGEAEEEHHQLATRLTHQPKLQHWSLSHLKTWEKSVRSSNM